MTKYFEGTPEEKIMFRTLHIAFDLYQKVYGLSKKQRDKEFVDSLEQVQQFKGLTLEQKFHTIVDALLRKMKDDLDIVSQTTQDCDQSFTFKKWVV